MLPYRLPTYNHPRTVEIIKDTTRRKQMQLPITKHFPDIFVTRTRCCLSIMFSRGGSSDFRLPTSDFQLPTSDFRLPTSDFRLPTSVAMKRGGKPAWLLRYAKMLLVPKTFFSLLLGRLCFRRFWLSRLFHIERSWHIYRFTVVFVSGRHDLPSYARAYSLKLFITAE